MATENKGENLYKILRIKDVVIIKFTWAMCQNAKKHEFVFVFIVVALVFAYLVTKGKGPHIQDRISKIT